MAFKDRLRQLREERGITQKQCAEELAVSYDNYNKWENGSSPNFDTLIKIASFFNVSTDYLLGASDTKKLENDNIFRRLGLKDEAISILEEKHGNKERKWFTKTVNELIENKNVLEKIGDFLFSTLSIESTYVKEARDGSLFAMLPVTYNYTDLDDDEVIEESYVEITKETLRELMLLEIQNELNELYNRLAERLSREEREKVAVIIRRAMVNKEVSECPAKEEQAEPEQFEKRQ